MKLTKGEKIFNIVNIVILSLLTIIILYPFLNVVAISFNEGSATTTNPSIIFPNKFTFENYITAFKYPAFSRAIFVSFAVTALATIIHITSVTLAAYVLSKKDIVFRTLIITFFLIPNFIYPGLVPSFLNIYKLGLLNKFAVYILPGAFSFFNFLILRTYIEGIPAELEESAVIDGANYFRIFISIIVPVAMPSIAAITLFFAVGKWNDWATNLYYIQNKKLYVVQFLLQQILRDAQEATNVASQSDYTLASINETKTVTATSIRMAALMITLVPIITVYPFLQKYFTKGMMLGAVKG